MHKTLSRIAVAGAGVATLLVFTASPAMADTDKTISNSHGWMKYYDDGDTFQVCDNNADGHGVTGELVQVYPGGATEIRLTLTDGGDSGCSARKGYNVGNGFNEQYEMWLSWNGGGATVKSAPFNE
ncbi:hypothetical protein G6045_25325 [Streptomyces sp. YC504]|uniref:Uncharacterized protein n=1 Tax=Streptomyces mesophilus TaxID=1775132 RepID=A0A6G4XP03_9ACTN|nr:hypothetical protein [Streptomyces mesophilus]NGO78953.1 hypothetical protein [Streptomyces mesophilus]